MTIASSALIFFGGWNRALARLVFRLTLYGHMTANSQHIPTE